jgi:hypothetical protein
MLRVRLTIAALSVACSAEPLPEGVAVLTSGHEPDVWSIEPAPVQARIDRIRMDGSRVTHASPAPPIERFGLGRGNPASYDLVARDEAGVARVRARSLPVDPAGFADSTLPLFVARTEGFARPPGELHRAHGDHPPAVVVGGRFLYVAGAPTGSDVATDAYDLGVWEALPGPAPLPCPVADCRLESLAIVDDTLLLAIGTDWARWYQLASAVAVDTELPEQLSSWAEVAGGRAVAGPDGTAYVVGAARAEPATDAVLVIDRAGELQVRRLFAPRAGAAATWVVDRGLVVVGGSTTGAGAELLADGAQAFIPLLQYPPDPTAGAALVVLDNTRLLRLGGRDASGAPAPSVELDLACAAECSALPRDTALELDQALAVDVEGAAVVAGTAADGTTAAFLFSNDTFVPVPLREPRRNATLLAAPTGHAALVGGTLADGQSAATIELFLPPLSAP